jgi:organic radical activating enzyme
MGWCSGTDIFDSVAEILLTGGDPLNRKKILKVLMEALEDQDWDCHYDSKFISNPVVREILAELHPWWAEEQDE